MSAFIRFILDRLTERSTWLGLVGLASAGGVAIVPEQADAMIAAGTSVASLIGVLTKD